jgi:hypothetical protein
MKKSLIVFLVGVVIGAVLTSAVFVSSPPPPVVETHFQQILDDLITEWTAPADTVHPFLAGFGDKKSDFKIGVIPDTVRIYAERIDSLFRIPKGVTISQWILESKWGLANLRAQNYFGLTFAAVNKYMPHPAYVVRMDLVSIKGRPAKPLPVQFAKFKSMEQCFLVYGKYLTGSPLYADAFRTRSPQKFARTVAKHYAQDPSYGLKLVTIMRRYDLE